MFIALTPYKMLLKNCESCNEIATRACGCENPPRFFCNTHIANHIISGGIHSIREAVECLSPSGVSSLRDTWNIYRVSSIQQAVQARNSRIESLLLKIRRADEECSSIIQTIIGGQIAKDIEQVLFYRALPLFSDSSVVRSLLDLKHAPSFSDFSSSPIHEMLISLNSSLLSSFPSSFSVQHFPSQIDITKQIDVSDPTHYRWELIKQTKAHQDVINSIAISDCERYIASASDDCTISIWNLRTLVLLRTLIGHTDYVRSVVFLGNKVVSGSHDKTIKIWEENRCVKTLNKHSGSVNSLCISSCKRLIVSGSLDKTAVVFRSQDDGTIHTLPHSFGVQSVAFSPNDKEIVSASGDMCTKGLIRIWNTETGQLLKTLDAHSQIATCVNFFGKLIVSSSLDNTVKIWDRNNDQPLITLNDHSGQVYNVDTRDNIVAYLSSGNRVIIRDSRNGSVIQTLQPNMSPNECLLRLKVLEEGKFIVSGGTGGNMILLRRLN